jgi:hypothetical protein
VAYAVRILVRGTDALSQPFKQSAMTVGVNCYGCQYQSKNYVQKNSVVTIEIPRGDLKLSPRVIRGRVVWVQRPRTYRHLFLIGIEFDVPGNVWAMESPPKDWFPHPEDEELVIPVYPEAPEPKGPARLPSLNLADKRENILEIPVDSQQVMETLVEAAVAKEIERVRCQMDTQLDAAIERAVKGLIERVTDAALENLTAPRVAESVTTEDKTAEAFPPKRRRKSSKPKI